jgi:tetratricopeptide (TPR) repeat protein
MLQLSRQSNDYLSLKGTGETYTTSLSAAQQHELTCINQDYYALIEQHHSAARQQGPLLTLGTRLWHWLQAAWPESRELATLPTQRFELHINSLRNRDGSNDLLSLSLLQAPWEILADQQGHFAQGRDTAFVVVRYLQSPRAKHYQPADRRLSLVFMAASPTGQSTLNYDTEELAIEQAAGKMQLDLSVEESGHATQLNQYLHTLRSEQIAVHALHLSCHGTASSASGGPPILCLEDELGAPELVSAPQLAKTVLQPHAIPLVFVSACQTQQAGAHNTLDYASELVLQGTPCVLAWAGSVLDKEATEFAANYYQQINQCQTPETALEQARNHLLQPRATPYRDWHLPRLLLAPGSHDTPLICNNRRANRVAQLDLPDEFLDSTEDRTKVARRAEFVGRRREIQAVLHAWRHTGQHSVLLQGCGGIGKSSIAARLAHRYPEHARIVLFGQAIQPGTLLAALNKQYRHRHKQESLQTLEPGLWPDLHVPQPNFAPLLRYCWTHEADFNKPLLIILDDLEQVLDDQVPAPRPCRELPTQHLLQDLISTLHEYPDCRSRLLLTSRYTLFLPAIQIDQLAVVPITAFTEPDRQRQLQRQHSLWQEQQDQTQQPIPTTIPHAADLLSLTVGNPGLQHVLTQVALQAPGQIRSLLDQVQHWQTAGTQPDDEELHTRVSQLGLQALYDQLTPDEQALLRASQLWPAPLPTAALTTLAQHYHLDIHQAGARLSGMTLWQEHRTAQTPESTWSLNRLAESVLQPLNTTEQHEIAHHILPDLTTCWSGPEQSHIQHHTLLWLALAGHDKSLIQQHTLPVLHHLNHLNDYRSGSPLAARILDAVQQHTIEMPFNYWRIAAELLQRNPETIQQAHACFAAGVAQQQAETVNHQNAGRFQTRYAELLVRTGQIDEAEEQIQQAIQHCQQGGYQRESAIAQGVLARIKTDQGQVQLALQLHEEELKVYEALGDQRERAVTLGGIARIRTNQGEVQLALQLHQEQLDVYEALGDQRERAVTLSDIARIKTNQGEVQLALRLHQERLATNRQLGDVDGIANSQWDLAKIYLQQSDTGQAIPCLLESFQLLQQTGRVDGLSMVGQTLGYVLLQAGATEEGTQILRISQQAYQKLGRSAKVAQIQTWLDAQAAA